MIYPSASSRALTHTRNAAGGIAHGAIDLIGGLSKFPCVCMNVVYSTPGALINMFTGEELLKDFKERNANIDLCFDTATEFLASYIPADADSKVYQYSRTGARVTGEAAMFAVGVGAAYKGYLVTRAGTAITTEYYTVAKSSRKFLKTAKTETQLSPNLAKVNDFHRVAMQLTKQEKNTIRILRGWAKIKGFKKLTPPRASLEEWGIFINNKFRWNLKIKPQAGRWEGLKEASKVPRYSARISEGKYLNPYTGEQVSKSAGSHFSLMCPYE